MEPSVVISLIMMEILKLIGLAIQVDFYIKSKARRAVYWIIMWSCYFLADILNFYNAYFHSLIGIIGFIFGILGVISYFIFVPTKRILIILGIVCSIYTFLFFFINIAAGQNFVVIVFLGAYLTQIIAPHLKFSEFKKQIGKSIGWYYAFIFTAMIFIPISITTASQGNVTDVYELEDLFLIILYYGGQFTTLFLLLIFSIHIEHNHSRYVNFKLKDMYSHDLGNMLQAIQLGFELLSKETLNEEDKAELYETISKKCKESSNLINKIRDLQT